MPEALIAALDELTAAWQEAMADRTFGAEFDAILREYAGVPSLLYDAERLSAEIGGARILLKREDLNHTGAHKIRNVLGQALLTKRMGKTRVIAETGAGQHGVASATAAAYFGLDCTVYMGSVDVKRQALNVARMQLLGAKVVPVDSGSATLKDAINEALRDWVASVDHTAYLFGTAAGPHPFPSMVRDFTRGIGDEARAQCLELTGRLPDAIAACVGGGSNAIGLFTAFLGDQDVAIYGFEAGGEGVETGRHAATIAGRRQRRPARRAHVRPAGRGRPDDRVALDLGRARLPRRRPAARPPGQVRPRRLPPVTDAQAMDALAVLARTEGIIAAIESAHALAGAYDIARRLGPEGLVLVNLSGRGDKDMETAIDWFDLGGDPMTAQRGDRVREGRAEGRAALVGYLPAGYPDVDGGIEALRAMVESGCDAIEIGLPYSDPVMDGPTIQAAAQQALERGVRTKDVLRTVEAVAATGVPALVMTYWNPVERYGPARFAADLAAAGGAGPDHARPDPRQRRRVDRRRRRPRPRQGLPRRAVLHRRAAGDDHRGLPRLRLRHGGHGRHRCPRHHQRAGRAARAADQGDHRAPGRRGRRSRHRQPGGRGGGVRRRRDRRLGVRPGAARPPRRPGCGAGGPGRLTEDLAGGVRRG